MAETAANANKDEYQNVTQPSTHFAACVTKDVNFKIHGRRKVRVCVGANMVDEFLTRKIFRIYTQLKAQAFAASPLRFLHFSIKAKMNKGSRYALQVCQAIE